jgi:hypothetical protein
MHDALALLRAAYAQHGQEAGPGDDEDPAIEYLMAELVAEIEAESEGW